MDTIKKFKNDISEKLKHFLIQGEIFAINEVAANMMAGIIMMIIILLTILCLVLNEVGIFTANKELMRIGTLVSIIVQVPIAALNQKYRGDKKWLKYVLQVGLLIQCGIMNVCLGHNVTLVMVIPVLISIRYFNAKFTRRIMWITYGVYILSSGFLESFGIINLNVFRVPEGTVIEVGNSLRAAIEAANTAREGYLLSYFINDVLPKFIVFAVIGVICIIVAKRGRELIDMQVKYTEKASRIKTELDLATEIQVGMLPCIFPAFPEMGQLKLYAKNIPAKEVGGDFYDYFPIDKDNVALVMADVSGKGVGAALFMTISKIVIKNLLQSGLSPAEAMTEANRQLCENNKAGLFVTTWIGKYNTSTDVLTFANAGHNPAVVVRENGECSFLHAKKGFVLAGMEGVKYTESTINLSEGDELFLYTDGVTEATNKNNELYGDDRLLNIINRVNKDDVKCQIEEILDDINKFVDGAEQFDDITMMAMKISR